ncbi:transcriptional regulator [Nonomuraea sp. NPDC048826]|uniref:transcriptional regulator n=1 Tax=Nonomuraea sp. NPDC048826 TaxID=3364347 RepID=UPI003717933B
MGILRIHFTGDDLARTTIAAAEDPLWEILISRFRLTDRDADPALRTWKHRLRGDHRRMAQIRPGARLLATLAPMGPYFPDFLTPAEGRQGLEPGLDAILSTPPRRLRGEIEQLARHTRLPTWVGPVADGRPAALSALTAALRAYHQAAIAPHPEFRSAVEHDRLSRVARFLDGGVEALLTSFSPLMRWRPPVLEVDYGIDKELRLDGRGLLLVPSYFCRRVPIALADPRLRPVLVYPISRRNGEAEDSESLGTLIGATRAAVLRSVGSGVTTTQLAHRLNISAASASRHAAVLRKAGLISSRRQGQAVMHTLTSLGTDLSRRHGATAPKSAGREVPLCG